MLGFEGNPRGALVLTIMVRVWKEPYEGPRYGKGQGSTILKP